MYAQITEKLKQVSLLYIWPIFYLFLLCSRGVLGCWWSVGQPHLRSMSSFFCVCFQESRFGIGRSTHFSSSVCLSVWFFPLLSINLPDRSVWTFPTRWEVRSTNDGHQGRVERTFTKERHREKAKKSFFSVKRADVRLNWTRLLFSKDTMILPIMYKR